MIVCFNCTAETKDELDCLIEIGSYRDYGEAIAAAVRNQLLMEKEVGSPSPTPRRKENGSARTSRNGPAAPPKAVAPAAVPALFQKEGFPEEPPAGLADLPADMWAPGQDVPLDRWVLGQQNRLLPAKVNARALIRLFLESPKGVPIGPTAERVAADAAVLGDYLTALDEARKVSRDDALATAFPTTAEDADKGRVRYANQFVVYQNGRGELSGLMVDLKLINIVFHRKERLIVPTRVAWEFARLQNPILDGPDGEPEKFSPEERSLLLRHIASSVPAEAFAYRAILEAVQAGNNSPDKIDAALKTYVTKDRAEKLSQSFLASQRSGAVSRMSDLRLIERQREGVRVSYALTKEGRAFLAQCAATKQ